MSFGMVCFFYGKFIVELKYDPLPYSLYIMFAGSIPASLNWVSELTIT